MTRRSPPRKVAYFEPVLPRLAQGSRVEFPARPTRILASHPPHREPGPTSSDGCASKISSPSAKVTQGCLLRVQIWRVGRSYEVSSSVPARTKIIPPRGRL